MRPISLARSSVMFLVVIAVTLASPTSSWASWWEEGLKALDSVSKQTGHTEWSSQELNRAFRQALMIGSGNVVTQLGQVDGFNGDRAIHIPLPRDLQRSRELLEKIGLKGELDELEVRLNRAAELATPRAKAIFIDAIQAMSFDNVRAVYDGPKTAATDYFRRTMSPALGRELSPLVDESLQQVGAVRSFNTLASGYNQLPFLPSIQADLTGYVVQRGLDGIFHYLATEEAAIRNDPARRTTELLQKVFATD